MQPLVVVYFPSECLPCLFAPYSSPQVFPQPSCRLFPASVVGEMRGQLFHYSEAVLDDETFRPQMMSFRWVIPAGWRVLGL